MSLKDLAGFFVGSVLLSHVVAPMLGNWLRSQLIKSEKDAIAWAHYKLRIQGQGHNPKSPAKCLDGRCRLVA